ncbi:hypothetical protein [Streptomyces misionensis]|uniref:hypothetical protein n=1 Tax=Streptomyces misionensis TaxID=67331 RepID=UPI0036BD27F8
MLKLIARTGITACVVAAVAGVWFTSSASTAANPSPPVTAANDTPGYAIEDFNYPGADRVQQDKGIVLKRGDGHIVLAECGSQDGLMEIWLRYRQDHVCFRVTGNSGYLSLEIPAVYAVRSAADQSSDVTMTVDDQEAQYSIPKGAAKPVGESTDPDGRDFTLLEISTSK